MFERYTEKARRVIFFARYEASQFGTPFIETEHILLGILREDKALASQFLKTSAAIDSIRQEVEVRTIKQAKVSTSVDLPLTHECKRVLAYAAEESERLRHLYISPAHLLVGLLREEASMAAVLLKARGLDAAAVREEIARSSSSSYAPQTMMSRSPEAPLPDLKKLLAQLRGLEGVTVATRPTVGAATPDFAVYEGLGVATDGDVLVADQLLANEASPPPGEDLVLIRLRIRFLTKAMENAIANHEFEKARLYSDEERQERDKLRVLRERYNLPEPDVNAAAPVLCIEIVRNEPFTEMRRRIDGYLSGGVAEVWMLDFGGKRTYTATAEDGFRECKGDVLRVAKPLIELDWKAAIGA